jgi:hypothetical protein
VTISVVLQKVRMSFIKKDANVICSEKAVGLSQNRTACVGYPTFARTVFPLHQAALLFPRQVNAIKRSETAYGALDYGNSSSDVVSLQTELAKLSQSSFDEFVDL